VHALVANVKTLAAQKLASGMKSTPFTLAKSCAMSSRCEPVSLAPFHSTGMKLSLASTPSSFMVCTKAISA